MFVETSRCGDITMTMTNGNTYSGHRPSDVMESEGVTTCNKTI